MRGWCIVFLGRVAGVSMRGGYRAFALLGVLGLGLAFATPGSAQNAEVSYTQKRQFDIPFLINADEAARLREVQLYVADEVNRNWRLYKRNPPTERAFPFTATRDGLFYFLVRTVDTDGQAVPAQLDGAPPGLKIVIKSTPPQIQLRAAPPQSGQVGVEWEIRDDAVDPTSISLEWRLDAAAWEPINIEGQTRGRKYWPVERRGLVDVRVMAKDRAGNLGSGFITVNSEGGGGSGGSRSAMDTEPRSPARNAAGGSDSPTVYYVNTLDFNLNFHVEEAGPSGISKVELYMIRSDAQRWEKYGESPRREPPFPVRVEQEGIYGFSILVRSGVGLGDRPPQRGELPQLYVEVDRTPPKVQLLSAEAARGGENGVVTLTWRATDRNLKPAPIQISYAERPEGPWTLVAENLENSGKYIWRLPSHLPIYRFHMRVEALDKAGNKGHADTDANRPVIVDLNVPKAKLIGVDPGPGAVSPVTPVGQPPLP